MVAALTSRKSTETVITETRKLTPAKLTAQEIEEQSKELTKSITTAIYKNFKVKLPSRQERNRIKVWYGTRDKLGLDIQNQLKAKGQSMDWIKWKEIYPQIFGKVENPTYPAEVVAAAVSRFYRELSLDPTIAMDQIVAFNQERLNQKNKYKSDDIPIRADEDEWD